jgi:hypothetical protein
MRESSLAPNGHAAVVAACPLSGPNDDFSYRDHATIRESKSSGDSSEPAHSIGTWTRRVVRNEAQPLRIFSSFQPI